ncbi:hypothetical protein GCM10023191_039910 [Actinoallomurus oryzae]|uniref:Uncharacterized protein n=1 Tax=Actinoallomurus oryzae TaxID=502180 RepID=A0ABP8Q3G5_9ACTN
MAARGPGASLKVPLSYCAAGDSETRPGPERANVRDPGPLPQRNRCGRPLWGPVDIDTQSGPIRPERENPPILAAVRPIFRSQTARIRKSPGDFRQSTVDICVYTHG